MPFLALEKDNSLLDGFFEPELMAIGDSLYNGVRSLTITGPLAALSAPARVASGLGLSFRVPDYPRPLLFDLEEELRHGVDFKRIRANIIENGKRWQAGAPDWSMIRFFDNISIAGADYQDLQERTAGRAREAVPALLAKLEQNSGLNFELTAKLYFALNIAFLLNPTGHPELDDLTPIEQVSSRAPKRLLINIGSNEGIFRTGLLALHSRENLDSIEQIPAKAQQLAETLRQHCSRTKRIYFNLLVRPRVLANLAPRTDGEIDFRGEGYYERYIARLGALNGMTDNQLKDIDDRIKAVNGRTRQLMEAVFAGSDQQITFIDLYELANRFDGKHFGQSRMIEVRSGTLFRRFSNLPFESNIFGFQHGGVFSLDNLHLSSLGYAIMANFIGREIASNEGSTFVEISPEQAFSQDTLLRDPPRGFDILSFLLGFAGLFGVGGDLTS